MSIRRSIVASVIGKPVSVALGLAASIIVARLLSPAEIGLFGVAFGVVAMLAGLAHFGAVDYLVQHRDPSREDFGRVLAVTVGIAVALAAAVWLSRAWFAQAYGEPRLAGLLALLAVNLVLGSIGVAAIAVLQRQYAFLTLQAVNLGAAATGAAVAIGLAWSGHGAESLAWGQTAAAVVTLAAFTLLRPAAVLCRPVLRGTWAIIRFGALRSLTLLMGNGADQAVPLILGRALGFAAVGFYDRAFGITSRLSHDLGGAVMRVLFVALAEAKGERRRLGQLLLVSTGNLTALMWPGFIVLAILAEPLIVLLYGEPWRASAPVLMWLAIGAMGYVLGAPPYELMTAEGDVGPQLRLECLGTIMKLGLVAALATRGLEAAAVGAAVGMWLLALVTWGRTILRQKVELGRLLRVLGPSAVLAVAAGVGPVGVMLGAAPMGLGTGLTLAVGCATALAGWVLVVVALSHPVWTELRALMGTVRMRGAIKPVSGSSDPDAGTAAVRSVDCAVNGGRP